MKKKQLTPMGEILHSLAAQETPAHFDLWERINSRADRRLTARRQNVLVGFVTLSFGVLIILALIFAIKSQPTVAVLASPTAEPSQTATEAPTASAEIKSYRGIIFGQSKGNLVLDNQAVYRQWQAYIWYQKPSTFRIEIYPICPMETDRVPGAVTGTPISSLGLRAEFSGPTFDRCPTPDLVIIHSDQQFLRIVRQGTITIANYSSSDQTALESLLPVDISAFIPFSEKSMDSMGHPAEQAISEVFSTLGTSSIIGRSAGKVGESFKFGSGDSGASAFRPTNRALWVDNQLGIPLAAEASNNDGLIIDSWMFTSLEINPIFDPGIFAYLPAVGTSITTAGLNDIWRTMPASFPVFVPGNNSPANIHIASTLIPNYPTYDAKQHVLTQTYLSRADPTKIVIALTITEQLVSGTPVAGYQYSEANGLRTLEFDRGGTHITIEGQATKQDLYDIANNLRPGS